MHCCTTELLQEQQTLRFRKPRIIHQVVAGSFVIITLLLKPTSAAEFQYFVADPPPLDQIISDPPPLDDIIKKSESEPETTSFEDQVRDMRIWLRQRDAERRQNGSSLDLSLPDDFAHPETGTPLKRPSDPFRDSSPDGSGYNVWGDTHFKLRNAEDGISGRTRGYSPHNTKKHNKGNTHSANKDFHKTPKENTHKNSEKKAKEATFSANQRKKSENGSQKSSDKQQVRTPATRKEKSPTQAALAPKKQVTVKPDNAKTNSRQKKKN